MQARTWTIAVLAALTVGICASGVSAMPPVHEPANNQSAALPAGLVCEFPFNLDVLVDRQKRTTFFNAEGEQVRQVIRGFLMVRLTNADTDESIVRRLQGSIVSRLGSDSVRVTARGQTFLGLFPTDFPPGPSATITSGRIVFDIDFDGTFHVLSQRGHVEDLCARLAG